MDLNLGSLKHAQYLLCAMYKLRAVVSWLAEYVTDAGSMARLVEDEVGFLVLRPALKEPWIRFVL